MTFLITAVPLFVVVIIWSVACAEHQVRMPFPWALLIATVGVLAFDGFSGMPLAAAGGISLVLFFTIGFWSMSRIEAASKEAARHSEGSQRSASLTVRRLSDHLPLTLRCGVTGILSLALAAFAWLARDADVPLLLPVAYAAAASVFFALFDSWMREEALAAEAGRVVRRLFAAQTILTASFLLMAHVALRTGPILALGVAGAILGGTGCALAISSGLRTRYLRMTIS